MDDEGHEPERPAHEPGAEDDAAQAQAAYVRGLIARGEAAWPVDGVLPAGATHEIVEDRPGQVPKVRRRRFSVS
jgi:hypothetical protein